ncbi:MAG: carbohydrate binding domain-containing protein [Pirellulaceae bacterium]|nr:carbohydrate binding domain-containing protein [Pirellulaceae bacterium]
MNRLTSVLPLLLLLVAVAPDGFAADWHHPLYLDGGGWWQKRIPVHVQNQTDVALAGRPVLLEIGDETGQAALVGSRSDAIRVCDAQGIEMLFALYGPDGDAVIEGPIPAGGTLVVPVECPAKDAAVYYVYFDNPKAIGLPDFLAERPGLVNGDVESGDGDAPTGWVHDGPDAQHNASWCQENPQAGRRCLKTVVAEGAEPTWIATRQHGVHVTAGARYRVRAWAKGHNVRGSAGWYIHVGNREQSMMTTPMLSAGDGTFDWKEVTIEFTVPATADRMSLGTVLRGTGTAWFDNVTLECLSPGRIAVEARPAESVDLRTVGISAPWYATDGESVPTERRAAVNVMNLRDVDLGMTLASVDLWRLEARTRGRLDRRSIVLTLDGRPVPHGFLGDQLLFKANLPAHTLCRYYLYYSDAQSLPSEASNDEFSAAIAAANLVQNPGFEDGETTPNNWSTGAPLQGPDGVTFGLDAPASEGFGKRCVRMHVPIRAPNAWRGWQQNVTVKPGRTYLVSAWLKCKDVQGGEVRVHAHRRTADGGLSKNEPYASIGPGISGTTDWTLLSGRLTMPEDTVNLHVHLTMEQSGTVWHDNVVVTEIVTGTVVGLEGKPSETPEQLAVWQVPAIVKVFRDDVPPREPGRIAIAAARNEREPLQLALRSTREIRDVQVEIEPLVGPDGFRLDDLEVTLVGYVPVDHPTNYYRSDSPAWHRKTPSSRGGCDGWAGMWPDPLLPQKTFDVAPEMTQPVWVTVNVPKQAPPGDYTGKLRLVPGKGDRHLFEDNKVPVTFSVPVNVHVWDFTLPDENHVAAIYDVRLGHGSSLWGKPLDEMYPEIIRFMASRRLCPDTIRPAPVFRRQDGRVTADFTEFDKAAEVYFDQLKFPFAYTPWDLYLFGWGHPPKTVFGERPYEGDPPYESADRSKLRPEYKRVYQEILAVFWNHLKEKGWHDKVVLYISDEPFDGHQHIRQQMKALCDMIHEVDPSIPIYSSTWKHVPEWDGYLDVWGIGHYGRVPVSRMAELRAAGDRLWFTTDGQMCTDTPYCAVERLLPHYCFKYGVEAYEFWGVAWLTYDPFRFGWHSYIHQSSEPGQSYWVRYPNGDGFLLYPGAAIGHDGLVSSIRFEQAREGVEDYEYLYLLKQLVATAKAAGKDASTGERALARAAELVEIPNAGGRYSTKILPDPDAVYKVRRGLAEAIESMSQ